MKLSHRQIEMLERSARNPGRPRPPGAIEVAGRSADADDVVNALADAMWAMERADAPAPSNPAEDALPVDAAAIAPPGDDATAVVAWQPIATAPPLRDLEVRVIDLVGRYPLLFPCRLVPGVGWINVLGNRRLTAEPVEWRDWLEEFPDFR